MHQRCPRNDGRGPVLIYLDGGQGNGEVSREECDGLSQVSTQAALMEQKVLSKI
jgi:hypothetical protein